MNSTGVESTKDCKRKNRLDFSRHNKAYTILEELPISIEELTPNDVILYAKQIGIDPQSEGDLLWIAKKGLIANLPFPWLPVEDKRGRLFYFNSQTSESSWEHPCDSFYRSLAETERIKGSSTTISMMSGLTSLANLHFVDEELSFKSDNGNANERKGGGREQSYKAKANNVVTNKQESDDEVESVEFELDIDAALEELSDESIATMDVTEDGRNDTKMFNEIHTILLNDKEKNVNENVYKYSGDSVLKKDIINNESEQKNNIKMQMSSSSASPNKEPKRNVKESITEKGRNNEGIDDEFLLEVGDEDPFADFTSDEQNANDLFSIDAAAGHKSSKQGNPKPSQGYQSLPNPTPKSLETVLETSERDEFGMESNEPESVRDEMEDDDQHEDEDYGGDDDEIAAEFEAKFNEITVTMSEKIETLRNELREEMRKQSNVMSSEMKEEMKQLNSRIKKNETELRKTINDIEDVRINQNKASNDPQILASHSSVDAEKIRREMQLLEKNIKEVNHEGINELRNELNRNVKTKVNDTFNQLDEKFMEFKDNNAKEIRLIRNDLTIAMESNNSLGQQTKQLKDDLSRELQKIDNHHKEQNKHLERISLNLDAEKEKFQNEIQRMKSIMNDEEKIKELEMCLRKEMSALTIGEMESYSRDFNKKINVMEQFYEQLKQQVESVFHVIEHNNKDMNRQTNTNDANNMDDDTDRRVPEKSLNFNEENLSSRIISIEESVNRICDVLYQIKPLIDNNLLTQQKGRDHKQDDAPLKVKILHFSDDDEGHESKSSTPSSSSLSLSSSKSEESKSKRRRRKHKNLKGSASLSSLSHTKHHCCNCRDEYLQLQNNNYYRVPLVVSPSGGSQRSHRLRDIRASSSSLINLIKNTTQKLKEEANELEDIGNYHFTSDIENFMTKEENSDDAVIKKLKSVRFDVNEKLKRLTNVLNQQKVSQI